MSGDRAEGAVVPSGEGVAIVTVAHESRAVLERFLGTVEVHLPEAQVIVVDCASSDGSAEAARGWGRGRATVLEPGTNLGYGRAANLGLEAVEQPVTVVANPDLELLDGSLARLAAEAMRPGAPERILAPRVLNADGSLQDSVHPEPGSPSTLLAALVPPAALPRPLRAAVEPWRGRRARAVAWAVGCCLVARTETLRRLGPFDQRIFLYAEDTELGLRAGDQGVQTWFWPHARVRHHQAHSTAATFGGENIELLARQRRAVVQERLGGARRRLDDWVQLLTFADRIALKALLRRPHARERAQLRALWRARREPPRLA